MDAWYVQDLVALVSLRSLCVYLDDLHRGHRVW